MEINDVLNEPEIKEMCTNAINKLEADNEMYVNLKRILISIIGDNSLGGETYSSLKLKYQDYCSVLNYLINDNITAIEAFSELRAVLQDNVYNGSEILPAYEAANRSVDYYDGAMQDALNAYNSYAGNPICPATLVAAAYSSYISYCNMKEVAEIRRDCYRNMMDYYDQVEASTRFAYGFMELISNNSVANSALQEISDSIVNGQYIPNTNAQWRLSIDNTVIDYEYYIRQFFVTDEIGENTDYVLDENGNKILDMNYIDWFFSADPSSINDNLYIAFSYVLSDLDINQLNEILSHCIVGFSRKISEVFVNACTYYYTMSCIDADSEMLVDGNVQSRLVNYNLQLSSALYSATQFASDSIVNNTILGLLTGMHVSVNNDNGYDVYRVTVDSYEFNFGSIGGGHQSVFDSYPWTESQTCLHHELNDNIHQLFNATIGNPVLSLMDEELRSIIENSVGMNSIYSMGLDTAITLCNYVDQMQIREALNDSLSYSDCIDAVCISAGVVSFSTRDLTGSRGIILTNPIFDERELIVRLACFNENCTDSVNYTIDDLCSSFLTQGELAERFINWYCLPVNSGLEGSSACENYCAELIVTYNEYADEHSLAQSEFDSLNANQLNEIINLHNDANYVVDISLFEVLVDE